MISIREKIAAALIAALGGSSGIVGLTIHRQRTRPIETDSLPAIMVYFQDDAPQPFDKQKFRSPLVERSLAIALQCRAQGSPSISPDQALDPVLVWAVMGGFVDETFGGLALGAEEIRTEWKSREADAPIAAATLHFSIRYRTTRLDPTSKT
jgi:hypothetical protein